MPIYNFNKEVFHEPHWPTRRVVDVEVMVEYATLLLRVERVPVVGSTSENRILSGSV
jgi:hypothetical protein